MNLTVDQFVRTANSGWFDNAVVLNKAGTLDSKFFHPKPDGGNKANWATNQIAMRAFREALENEFGSTGTAAFDRLLNKRYVAGRSLRKSDVNAVMAEIQDAAEAAAHEKAHAERTVSVFAEETLGKILADKSLPYHALSKDDQAALRKEAMESFKTMMNNEASKENILGEIKAPKSVKFFEARMAVLVKDAAENPAIAAHLRAQKAEVKDSEIPSIDDAVEAFVRANVKDDPKVKAEPKTEVKTEAKAEAKVDPEHLRNELRSHFDELWSKTLNNPRFRLNTLSTDAQKHQRDCALEALENRMKDEATLIKLHNTYEKAPKALEDALFFLATLMDSANINGYLIED